MVSSAAVLAALLIRPFVFAQAPDGPRPDSTPTITLDPERIVQLLRQPNGLEAAANLVGNFVTYGEPELWGDCNLATVVEHSSLGIVGTVTKERSWLSVTKERSWLSEDGDDIFTDVTVQVDKVLKGSAHSSVVVTIPGGLYHFSSGNTAQATTVEWRELQVGTRHLLLLTHDPYHGGLKPAVGVESLFRLPAHPGVPEPFAALDIRPHQIINGVKGMSADALIAAVQSLGVRRASSH